MSEVYEAADREFLRALGQSPIAGHGGPLYTYTIFVQKGLGLRLRDVVNRIEKTLADPRGWTRDGGVRFQRIERDAQTWVYVAEPDAVDILCLPLQTEGYVSCSINGRVVLNSERWKYAVPHWTGSVRTYRQMVVNHEFGHRIGKGHGYCPGHGGVAPVMQQQTYGLQGCHENSWPLASELVG